MVKRHNAISLFYSFRKHFLACLAGILFSISFLSAQTDTTDSIVNINGLTPFNSDHLKRNVNVVILDISENDLFYPKRSNYIGRTGSVGSSRLVKNRDFWYKGSIKLSNGKRRFFEEVKISIEVPTKQPLVHSSTDSLATGTRVKILGLSESDLYYPNFEKILHQTGTATTALIKNGDNWWSGEIKLDNGYICRFHQVKVEIIP